MSDFPVTAPERDDAVAARQTSTAMAEGLVRMMHPEKIFDFLPGMTSTATLAGLYGLDEHTYRALRQQFARQVAQAAEHLLAEGGLAAALAALPFGDRDTLAVIGESSTDAADSWWEILDQLLHRRRPGLTLINAAISGYPTTVNQRILSGVLARHRPDWVVFCLGGNDALRYGHRAGKPLVSLAETTSNLAEMRRAASAAGSRVIWVTPSAVDLERTAAYPPMQAQGIWAAETGLAAIAEAVRHQAHATEDLLVDLDGCFGEPPDQAFLQADGLHPTPAGQQTIARAFVHQLAGNADKH